MQTFTNRWQFTPNYKGRKIETEKNKTNHTSF